MRCSRCNRELDPDAAICVHCGIHQKSGRNYSTRIEDPEGDDDGPSMPPLIIQILAENVPGLFRPWIMLMSLMAAIFAAAVAGLCVFIVMIGAILVAFPIGSVAIIMWAQAIGWMLTGETAMLVNCLIEFNNVRWLLFFSLLFSPLGILYILF
jgi:hypothetical protein